MTKEALDDLRWFGKRFKGLLSLVPLLEEYDTLDNFIKEKQQEALAIETEVNGSKATFKKYKQDILKIEQDCQTRIADAEKSAKSLIQESEDRAKKEYDNLVSKYQKESEKYKEVIKSLKDSINAEDKKLQELNDKVLEKTQKLISLQESIDNIKNRFN